MKATHVECFNVCKTYVLPVVITGCLAIRKEHRLRGFQNRMLGKMFGFKKDDIRGEWRRLHTEKRRDLYSSRNVIRVIL
jgi:hypothetical protein